MARAALALVLLLALTARSGAAPACASPLCDHVPSVTFGPGERWFPVDFRFDGNSDIADNLAHYRTDAAGRGLRTGDQAPVVYGHESPGDAAAGSEDPRFTTLEYWYYYVNDPDHLHDWESVYVVLENGTPARVVYYQHFWSQVLPWDRAPRDGSHPLVASQEGKHASYPGAGRGGAEIPWSNFTLLADGAFPTEPGGTWSCSIGCIARVDAPWCRERWGSLDRCSASPLPPVAWAWMAGLVVVAVGGGRGAVRTLRGRRGARP